MKTRPSLLLRIFKTLKQFFIKQSYKIYRIFFTASNTRNAILLFGFIVLLVSGYVILFWDTTKNAFIGTVAGIITTGLVSNLVFLLSVWFEDKHKVARDNRLVEDYYGDRYLKLYSQEKPYEFHYDYIAKKFNKITISDSTDWFKLDPIIEQYFSKLYGAHRGSYKENIVMLRVNDAQLNGENLTLQTSRTTYINHLLTNRVVDYPFEKSMSLRMLFEPKENLTVIEKVTQKKKLLLNKYEKEPTTSKEFDLLKGEMLSLKESKFSNHLGIIGLIKTVDDHLIIKYRSANATISKNSFVAPLAMGLNAPANKEINYAYIEEVIKDRLHGRLGIKNMDVDMFPNITPIGFGRDIYEGGKPQLFFLIESTLTAEAYIRLFNQAKKNQPANQIDFDKKAYATKFSDIDFEKNEMYLKSYQNNKTSIHWHRAEINLVVALKCMFELHL